MKNINIFIACLGTMALTCIMWILCLSYFESKVENLPFTIRKVGNMSYLIRKEPGYAPTILNYSLDSIQFEQAKLELQFMQESDTEEKNSK